MATTVTHIVDPNSGAGFDYDSLYDWEAGEQGDLTGVRDEISVAKCRCTGGTADTTGFTVDGWVTSATQYIKIWTDPTESYRHAGVWPTGNKYVLSTGDASVTIAESYTKIFGICHTVTGGSDGIQSSGYVHHVEIAYCILRATLDSGSEAIYSNNLSADFWKIYNNIIYDHSFIGVWQRIDSYMGWLYYNNTFHNCGTGIKDGAASGTSIAINNLFSTCTTNASGTFAAPTDYNATDDASIGYTVTGSGNTHDHVSHTFTFANEGGDNFHLASTDVGAIDLGVSDPGSGLFSDDIDGVARGATWDIGADEYVAAVSALSISVSEALSFAEALD